MSQEDKLCVLLFDEVSLKAHLTYGEKRNKITDFVDDGNQKEPLFTHHAQSFHGAWSSPSRLLVLSIKVPHLHITIRVFRT